MQQQWLPENPPAMTFDEVSMERSKSFVKALQELKNLRPQLYSAAEYCEKSYLHNEQKQMVLDNLKDYAVRALVNAVDHLGTVAYKLTDLLEQQTFDVSTIGLKVSCLNQRVLTCQTYMDIEGIRQQQMLVTTPKHHKHYILPNSASKHVRDGSNVQTDAVQYPDQAKPRPYPPGTPGSKPLAWHLAAESNSQSNESPDSTLRVGDLEASKMTSGAYCLHDSEKGIASLPLSRQLQSAGRTPISNEAQQSLVRTDLLEVPKSLTAFRSFDNHGRLQIYRPPVRNKSMLAAFFAKTKSSKQKRT